MSEVDGPVVTGNERPDHPPTVEGDAASQADLAVARSRIERLLAAANITRVICVDDTFAPDLSIVVDGIAGTAQEIRLAIGALLEVDVEDDRAVWEPDVQEAWDGMDESARRRLVSQVLVLTADEAQPDVGLLADLLPEDIEFVALTATEWSDQYANNPPADGGTLVLFDRDHGEGNENLGIKLAADLFRADQSGNVWAGLLTHTVTADEELDQAAELAQLYQVPADRFVVIAKEHLDRQPTTLPHSLKVTLMAPAAHRLRKAVSEAIVASVEAATDQLNLDPHVFERVVFGSSAVEGIWEPETLLRLFNIIVRSLARHQLFGMDPVWEATRELRQYSEIDLEPNENLSFEHARSIRHLEIYEKPEHVNEMHLPTELGDLYKTDGGKVYVLVEQPCDLMVRRRSPAGQRSNDFGCGHLLEVRANEPSNRGDAFLLPAFEQDAPWFVHYAKSRLVPLEVLDFCVFNTSGESSLDVSQDSSDRLWPAWSSRYVTLASTARQLVTAEAGQLSNDERKALRHQHYTTRGNLTPSVVGQVVRFPIRRIGRVLPPYNRALLTSFSAHQARADFEVDFTSLIGAE